MQAMVQSCRAVDALSARLAALGLSVTRSTDFAAFQVQVARCGRDPAASIFDPRRGRVEGVWLALLNRHGQICSLQAVVHAGRAAPDLAAHFHAKRNLYMPLGHGIDPWRSAVVSRVARGIAGAVCYHGEFFVVPTLRGQGVAAVAIRLAQLVAWQRWRPEVFFGFTLPATTSQRFADAMGYGGFEHRTMIWRDAAGRHVRDEGLVYSCPQHLRALVRNPFLGIAARSLSPVGQ